jgi:hypothetical protein
VSGRFGGYLMNSSDIFEDLDRRPHVPFRLRLKANLMTPTASKAALCTIHRLQ